MAGSPWLSCYLSKKLLFPFVFTCTCNTQATNCYYLGLPTFWHWNMMVLSRNVLNLIPSCVETQPAHGLQIAHNFLTNPYVLWQKAQAYFYCSQTHSTGQQMALLAWECLGLDMSNFCRHIKLSRHRETEIIILPATPQGPSSVKKMFWMKKSSQRSSTRRSILWRQNGAMRKHGSSPRWKLSPSLTSHVTLDYLTFICHLLYKMGRTAYQL